MVERGALGLGLFEMRPNLAEALAVPAEYSQTGLLVGEAIAGGPASSAFFAGDIVLSLNEEPIRKVKQFRNEIGYLGPGSKARFGILRSGNVQKVEIELGKLEDLLRIMEQYTEPDRKEPPSNLPARTSNTLFTDVEVANLIEELRKEHEITAGFHGIVVTHVVGNEDSDSEEKNVLVGPYEAGLRVGYLITEINFQPVTSIEEAAKKLESVSRKAVVVGLKAEKGRDSLAGLQIP